MEKKIENGQLTVKFTGRLDTESAKGIDAQLNEDLEKNSINTVIFDLGDISYMVSTFLRVCISMKKNTEIKSFKIINVTPASKNIFKIAGLDQFFEID